MKSKKIEIHFVKDDYGMVVAKWGYHHYRKFHQGSDIYINDVKDPSFWGTYTYTHGGELYKKICRYIADMDNIVVNSKVEIKL